MAKAPEPVKDKIPFDPHKTVTIQLTYDEMSIAFAANNFALGMGAYPQKRQVENAQSLIKKLWAARAEFDK